MKQHPVAFLDFRRIESCGQTLASAEFAPRIRQMEPSLRIIQPFNHHVRRLHQRGRAIALL